MANNFILPPNPSLDRIVRESSTGEGGFDAMKDALHKKLGLDTVEQTVIDSGYGRTAAAEPSRTPLPIVQHANPSAPPTHYRVIYPYSNSRFELVGMSEADLDEQEAKIRALYQN